MHGWFSFPLVKNLIKLKNRSTGMSSDSFPLKCMENGAFTYCSPIGETSFSGSGRYKTLAYSSLDSSNGNPSNFPRFLLKTQFAGGISHSKITY